MSYFWKLDSLGQNGFRLFSYEKLYKCKLDKVTSSYLIEKLGKPNFIDKDREGDFYCYYYYDGKSLPKEANKVPERLVIHFYFKKGNPYLQFIGKDHLD